MNSKPTTLNKTKKIFRGHINKKILFGCTDNQHLNRYMKNLIYTVAIFFPYKSIFIDFHKSKPALFIKKKNFTVFFLSCTIYLIVNFFQYKTCDWIDFSTGGPINPIYILGLRGWISHHRLKTGDQVNPINILSFRGWISHHRLNVTFIPTVLMSL